jgi:hypothetical protein
MKTEYFSRRASGTAILILGLLVLHSPLNAPAQTAPSASDNATTASALPPNIYPTSPLAQVIRLTQAGVDESVIMTYVTNSPSTFNLDSDKIIYLRDLGLPNDVVTAMMQRDQALQQQMASTTYQPPAQPATEPAPTTTEPPSQPEEPSAPVTVTYFYNSLAPYGSWVDIDGYGRCWRPSVCVYNPGWQPYCDHGHWVYTDCGWYWYSDYSWGWAPFHYGRWFQHPHWGWCWTPDTVWGPSWVTWRYSSGYCGWAPLPPFATYEAGVGFFYRGAAVSIGFDWDLSDVCFVFVPTRFFCDPHPRSHCVPPTQVKQIFNQTTIINNFNGHGRNLVNRGIDPERITAITHTPIHQVALRDADTRSGHGPRNDQFSRDGKTLTIGRPPQSASPAQNRPSQPNINRPTPQPRPVREPQEHNNLPAPGQNPTQRPSTPVNYYSSPAPVTPRPNYNYNNRTSSPRMQEQQTAGRPYNNTRNIDAPVNVPASSPEQYNAPEAGYRNQPAAAPVERPQHQQSSASQSQSSPSRSSGQNQDQGGSGNGPGNGPRH